MHVVPGERVLAQQRLGVGGAELVVRERQVRSTALDVEAEAEPVDGDGAALDVPPGPAGAEFGLPGGLAGAGRAPQQRVERVAFAGPVRVAAPVGEDRGHGGLVVVRLVAEPAGERAVEVDVRVLRVVDTVGGPVGQQFRDDLDDLRDGLHGAGELAGRQHPQRRHVRAEPVDLPPAELDPVLVVAVGALQQRVVDVGDVLHVVHLVPGVQPLPVHQVEGQVGGGVADVGGVVGRDAADVHPGHPSGRRGPQLPGRRVVQPQRAGTSGDTGHGYRGPSLHVPNLMRAPRRWGRPADVRDRLHPGGRRHAAHEGRDRSSRVCARCHTRVRG